MSALNNPGAASPATSAATSVLGQELLAAINDRCQHHIARLHQAIDASLGTADLIGTISRVSNTFNQETAILQEDYGFSAGQLSTPTIDINIIGLLVEKLATSKQNHASQLAQTMESHAAELQLIRENHASQLAQAKESHATELQILREKHTIKLKNVKEDHDIKSKRARKRHRTELQDLQNELDATQEAETQLTKENEELDAELVDMQNRLTDSIAAERELGGQLDQERSQREEEIKEAVARERQKLGDEHLDTEMKVHHLTNRIRAMNICQDSLFQTTKF
ncbi:hypothetical protein B0T17DRAFT_620718 [Bombardia bombarda]|uniref:Uncharacterized protein n=1 Tax=Bombardia bombarda TaxID=252184 RepID=A0AA39TPN7_9PEZI|nr:hypothetical protein B0T17DRAFT_620718 [Bombardia bombarda]